MGLCINDLRADTIDQLGVVFGRIEWEDGRVSYVSERRMKELNGAWANRDRIAFEGAPVPPGAVS